MVQCKCFLYEFINLELYLEYKDPRFYLEILKILESGFIKGFQVQQWIGATMVLKKIVFGKLCYQVTYFTFQANFTGVTRPVVQSACLITLGLASTHSST